jgi:lincosamide nucleotidyltransferase A/C/D/E
MLAEDVVALHDAVTAADGSWCLAGGWGVDALLGRQTRPHKDVDVLVERDRLRAVLEALTSRGFRHAYAWEENVPLDDTGDCAGVDSAFVMEDASGRSVDIHVYDVSGDAVRPLWAVDLSLAAATGLTASDLSCDGQIAGVAVTCLSAARQLELHVGYALPASHRADVELLEQLCTRP